MTLYDTIIDMFTEKTTIIYSKTNEELTDLKEKEYNWSYDANGSPIEEEANE